MDNNPDHLFPPIMTNMVRAGETGGFLDKSLITVADSFEADVRLQVRSKAHWLTRWWCSALLCCWWA